MGAAHDVPNGIRWSRACHSPVKPTHFLSPMTLGNTERPLSAHGPTIADHAPTILGSPRPAGSCYSPRRPYLPWVPMSPLPVSPLYSCIIYQPSCTDYFCPNPSHGHIHSTNRRQPPPTERCPLKLRLSLLPRINWVVSVPSWTTQPF